VNDLSGKASTLHSLATIDSEQGFRIEAKRKLDEVLTIARRIGDSAAEAPAWHSFGMLAKDLGRGEIGLTLIFICGSIFAAIGHRGAKGITASFLATAAELGFEEEALKRLADDAVDEYERDRGSALLKQAFSGT
jgi:hypothetical protein